MAEKMGNLVLKGEKNRSITDYVIGVIVFIVLSGVGIWAANQFGYIRIRGVAIGATGLYNWYFWGGIVLGAIFLLYYFYIRITVGKTHISVYENGISGAALDIAAQRGNHSATHIHNFQVTFDRITSVSTTTATSGKRVVINEQGKEYVAFAENAEEIANAINNKLL